MKIPRHKRWPVFEDEVFEVFEDDVTKQAQVVLLDRQFNKVTYLPDPEDVVKFNDCLNTYVRQLDLTTTTPENFKKITEIGAAKLTLYNRRRPGEVENLT